MRIGLQFAVNVAKIERPGTVFAAPNPGLTEGDLLGRSHMTAAYRSMPILPAQSTENISERGAA